MTIYLHLSTSPSSLIWETHNRTGLIATRCCFAPSATSDPPVYSTQPLICQTAWHKGIHKSTHTPWKRSRETHVPAFYHRSVSRTRVYIVHMCFLHILTRGSERRWIRHFFHHDTSGIYLHPLSIIRQQSNYRLESEASITGAMQLAWNAREKKQRHSDASHSVRKREASCLKLQACQRDV